MYKTVPAGPALLGVAGAETRAATRLSLGVVAEDYASVRTLVGAESAARIEPQYALYNLISHLGRTASHLARSGGATRWDVWSKQWASCVFWRCLSLLTDRDIPGGTWGLLS
ncbi:hypothetical protein NDU88_004885 [Pleurodeles waltl]|uniref:Uncharacterized protein n=1 Tax=Pleurodeles waltl TaxID=8319 RepID=A0AAV7WA71_PLEWA|nr:hypothetical protein NDU88_004885 [Pleurodeles waltl]